MQKRRILWSLMAVIAAALAFGGVIDSPSERYADAALKRALVTFAVARTLNGVISVAQGTEVAVEPGGVGVTFTLGQVLDPINDLVERFSGVMLVAASSLGLQNVLLGMSGWWGINLLVLVSCAYALFAIWMPATDTRRAERAERILLVSVFVRFAVPLVVIATNLVFDTFLAAQQDAATVALDTTRVEIQEISDAAAPRPQQGASLADRVGAIIDDSVSAMNVRERLDRFGDRVSDTSEHVVMLIVIFVLETILLPIGFVWLLAQVLKLLVSRATGRSD
ncbi:MAG: hypothetical protein OES78_08340 [Chromatiales bacterium]|nr:hypothetical protein [Chromatiales bacterium]MDH3894551.1 hypothetical protein [Chromatiales bacterium]